MCNTKKGNKEIEELLKLWKSGNGKSGSFKLSCGCTAHCNMKGFPWRIDGPILYASEVNDSLTN